MTDTPPKLGRPPIYTKELGTRICTRIAQGEPLSAICAEEGMPHQQTVYGWALDDQAFFMEYARARDMQADFHADEITTIADDARNDWMKRNDPDNPGYVENGESLRRSQLRIEARKWIAAKLKPRKYGDKQMIEVVHRYSEMSDEELERAALAIIEGSAEVVH